jgi:hypothetical protein
LPGYKQGVTWNNSNRGKGYLGVRGWVDEGVEQEPRLPLISRTLDEDTLAVSIGNVDIPTAITDARPRSGPGKCLPGLGIADHDGGIRDDGLTPSWDGKSYKEKRINFHTPSLGWAPIRLGAHPKNSVISQEQPFWNSDTPRRSDV